MTAQRLTRPLFGILFVWLMLSPIALMSMNSVTPDSETFFIAEISITEPDDLSFENGTFGEVIVWNATTLDPKNYTVTRNETVIDSDSTWDGDLIEIPVDWIYRDDLVTVVPILFVFTCTAMNEQNETATDTVHVTVFADETAPELETPDDFGYEEGSFGHYLKWNVSEPNPDTYNITSYPSDDIANVTIVADGPWDGSNFSINIDGLEAPKWYMYTLWVNDTLGHISTSSVNVTVYEDISDPEIDSPDDFTFEFGDSPYYVTWHVYDSNPLNYTLNVTIISNDPSYGNASLVHDPPLNITLVEWILNNPDGDDIAFPVHELYVGNYSYELTLYDADGRNVSDTVNFTIYHDIRSPNITSPGDLTYEEGITGYTLEWFAEESNPISSILTRNEEILSDGRWYGENITINVDGYEPGEYIFNLTLIDYFEHVSVDIVLVNVTPDSQLPYLAEITTIEAFATASSNTIIIQGYASDTNGIKMMSVEWRTTTNTTTETDEMELLGSGLYSANIGEFILGTVIQYRIIAQDNSTVENIIISEWYEYTVTGVLPPQTPGLIWVGLLGLGFLSLLVIVALYFRTRTKR
ncbi:MAG: hypothetical protein RTU92_04090 [Candidatus Thorarchaeota archaeon]